MTVLNCFFSSSTTPLCVKSKLFALFFFSVEDICPNSDKMMKIQNTKRPTFHRISNSDENSDDSSEFRMDPTSNIHLVKVESSSSPMSKNSSVVGNPSLLPLGEARIDFTWTVNGSLSKRSVVQIKIFQNFFRTTQACKNSRAEKNLKDFSGQI